MPQLLNFLFLLSQEFLKNFFVRTPARFLSEFVETASFYLVNVDLDTLLNLHRLLPELQTINRLLNLRRRWRDAHDHRRYRIALERCFEDLGEG